jgi:hypothetical protein
VADLVRVLRVIEYVGPRKAVEGTLNQSRVRGTACYGDLMIRSAIVGDFPEILGLAPNNKTVQPTKGENNV